MIGFDIDLYSNFLDSLNFLPESTQKDVLLELEAIELRKIDLQEFTEIYHWKLLYMDPMNSWPGCMPFGSFLINTPDGTVEISGQLQNDVLIICQVGDWQK